jgi:NAD(P)-dependent dehydrogenase (short-subunit alcohol dehydrogenase family)
VDGGPAIHITGQGFGVMTTKESFGNCRVRLQVKWGERKWGYKLHAPRDCGLLYYGHGPQGFDHGTWPRSIEFQIEEHNMGDLWATRTYVIDKMGGIPNLVICNSGLTERGYSFGRSLREVEGESMAKRRAKVRQAFINNLAETRAVLDTKIDGFMAMTHLWSGEAVYANEPLTIVYISSRQSIDPGASVPGYAVANWAVLQLPQVLAVNLGKAASLITAYSVMYPFVRTGMTNEYAENPKVFGRWQPRMLETYEAAEAFMQLLALPGDQTNQGMFEVLCEEEPAKGEKGVKVSWKQVKFNVSEEVLAATPALTFG